MHVYADAFSTAMGVLVWGGAVVFVVCCRLSVWTEVRWRSRSEAVLNDAPQRKVRSGPGCGSAGSRPEGAQILPQSCESNGGWRPFVVSAAQAAWRESGEARRQEHANFVDCWPRSISWECSISKAMMGIIVISLLGGK